ncbi:hypothetical protein GNP63_14270 [Aliivibrio fischeri]|uniref:enterotoxin A family protein n=1 Tax=Aliivibrio fischeri TaxID=668 RepID=UPI0012D92AED|nr:enterotoxin A family protein [Aliivibrio fischeri]MUH97699.1 hypothetical protein [Aliivibrio fischeri]MUI62398.1 hypothetical protein [Aliivibrio fischeri]
MIFKRFNKAHLVFCLTFFIFLLLPYQKAAASNIFYRFDTRSPEEIRASNGFIPKGDDTLVINHVMDTHLRGDSGYVSFTTPTGIANLSNYFHDNGHSNIWLYRIEVPYPLLPAQNILRQTFQNQVSLFRTLFDSNFPGGIDPFEFDANYSDYIERFGIDDQANSFLATMFSTTSALAIYQDQEEVLSIGALDFNYVTSAEYVELQGRGEYRVLETRELNPIQHQGVAPSIPLNATNFMVELSEYSEAQREILRQNGTVQDCSFASSLRNNEVNETCSPYVNKVMVPRLFIPSLKFLADKTMSHMNFGEIALKWVTHNKNNGIKRDHCGVTYNDETFKHTSVCLVADSNGNYSSKNRYTVILNDFGLEDGGRGYPDINGDGNNDLCRIVNNPTRIRCSLSYGTGFRTDIESGHIEIGNGHQRWWADVNGDDVSDFCRIINDKMHCSLGKRRSVDSNSQMFGDTILFSDNDYGLDSFHKFVDIIGDGTNAFCRLINQNTTMRCNYFDKESNTFKKIESNYIDGGYDYYHYWAKYDGRSGKSFCRSVDDNDHKTYRCLSYDKKQGFIDHNKFSISISPFSPGNVQFVDLYNRGIDDLCVVDVHNMLTCYVYKGNDTFSSGFQPKSITEGTGSFINGDQHILGIHNKTKIGQFCRYIGQYDLKCLEFQK